jgi:hypothetical protein
MLILPESSPDIYHLWLNIEIFKKISGQFRIQWLFPVDLVFGYFLIRGSSGKGIPTCLRPEALKSNRILCYYKDRSVKEYCL